MKYNLVSDQELIDMYCNGDHKAIETLINRHKDQLYRYIFINIREKHLVDDFFQDTFIKIIVSLREGNYSEKGKFLAWARRIAHNLIMDHYRVSKRIPVMNNSDEFDIFDFIKSYDENTEDKMVMKQIHADVAKLIEYLPEEQREVIMLKHYCKLSFKEIAEETNVSINTALGRMHYALMNLRRLIKKHNIILEV